MFKRRPGLINNYNVKNFKMWLILHESSTTNDLNTSLLLSLMFPFGNAYITNFECFLIPQLIGVLLWSLSYFYLKNTSIQLFKKIYWTSIVKHTSLEYDKKNRNISRGIWQFNTNLILKTINRIKAISSYIEYICFIFN